MGLQTSSANTAAIGISIENVEQVDVQMASLKSKGETSTSAPDTDGMQVEGAGTGADSMALVRPGSTDVAMQANMALALAPRIGESGQSWYRNMTKRCSLTITPDAATNVFSYLSSFAPDSATQTVPLLKRWLEQFERKVKGQGVGFLAKEAE